MLAGSIIMFAILTRGFLLYYCTAAKDMLIS